MLPTGVGRQSPMVSGGAPMDILGHDRTAPMMPPGADTQVSIGLGGCKPMISAETPLSSEGRPALSERAANYLLIKVTPQGLSVFWTCCHPTTGFR